MIDKQVYIYKKNDIYAGCDFNLEAILNFIKSFLSSFFPSAQKSSAAQSDAEKPQKLHSQNIKTEIVEKSGEAKLVCVAGLPDKIKILVLKNLMNYSKSENLNLSFTLSLSKADENSLVVMVISDVGTGIQIEWLLQKKLELLKNLNIKDENVLLVIDFDDAYSDYDGDYSDYVDYYSDFIDKKIVPRIQNPYFQHKRIVEFPVSKLLDSGNQCLGRFIKLLDSPKKISDSETEFNQKLNFIKYLIEEDKEEELEEALKNENDNKIKIYARTLVKKIKEESEKAGKEFKASCYFDKAYYIINWQNAKAEKKFPEAFELFKKSAEAGFSKSFFYLAECYKYGKGCKTNKELAFKWYKKSAESDNSKGCLDLGECYFYGKGTDKDENAAFRWIRRAVILGERSHDAFYLLSDCYSDGYGTAKDLRKADKYYKKAIAARYVD